MMDEDSMPTPCEACGKIFDLNDGKPCHKCHVVFCPDCARYTFNLGIPDFDSLIVVDDYGLCQLRHHYEDGDVLLYMGSNRMFRVPGSCSWRYAR